jgi:hypothetical protein
MPATTKTLSAQNTFTDAVHIIGDFNLSISGTFVATLTVQRSTDGTVWRDVDTFSAPSEEVGYDPMKNFYDNWPPRY